MSLFSKGGVREKANRVPYLLLNWVITGGMYSYPTNQGHNREGGVRDKRAEEGKTWGKTKQTKQHHGDNRNKPLGESLIKTYQKPTTTL